MGSNTVVYQLGYDYLVGVNTPGGDARNVAATGTPTTIQNAGGDTISFSMTQVNTMVDIETSLGIDAQASGGCGLFSASARMDYAKKCNINSSSVFLIVSVQVTQAFTSVKTLGIDPTAAALIANGKTAQFQEQYGDKFVRGLQTGGQFFGVIEIATENETDKEKVQVDVSGSYATISGSGSVQSDFSKTIANHNTHVQCYYEGGDSSILVPTAVDTMIARATGFPRELQGHGVPYLALLDDYSVLPLPNPPTFADLQLQKDVLAECARLRGLDLVIINDIDYIVNNSAQFIDATDTTKYPLTQWRNDLGNDLDTIAAAASFAINNPASAKMPVTTTPLPLSLPQRLKGVPLPPPAPTFVTIPGCWGDAETIGRGGDLNGVHCPSSAELGLLVNYVSVPFPPGSTQDDIDQHEGDLLSLSPDIGTTVRQGTTVTASIRR